MSSYQKDNKALGVVSERDTLKLIQKDNSELQKPISTYMSSPVITIHKNQTVLNAQSIMKNSSIRRLVVVDDDEKIAGILTRHDLIKSIPEYYVEILREIIDRQKQLVSQTQIKLDEETIFHNAMKSLPHNLVFMTNPNGSIQFISIKESQLCTIATIDIGTQIESLEGNLFDIIKNTEWKNLVNNGETLHKIVKIRNKYAKFCYFHTSISMILSTNNEFEGYMYIARDISQQQTLEKELKRLNKNIHEAYKIAKIGNWKLDAKTFSAFWSKEICDIIGMEHNTQGGLDVLKTLVTSEDFEVIENSLLLALQTGSSHEMVYQLFPKNGLEPCWVECHAHREIDEDGKPKSLIGTLQNVTHRIKAEKRIEHLNSLLKAIRNINQHIVKEKDTSILMQAICNEITIVKRFSGVWILLQDTKKKLYSTGFDKDSLDNLKQNLLLDTLPPCCNTQNVLQRYTQPQVNCSPCPLSQSHSNTDAVVVPIIYEGNFYGHIGLSMGYKLIEDTEERELVQEMANDIAFSIFTIKERETHKIELEKSYEMLYKLTENIPGAIYQYRLYPDGSSRFPYASQSIENIYEASPKDLFQSSDPALANIYSDDIDMIQDSIKNSAERMEEWNLEYRVNLPKKGIRWLHGKSKPEKLEDGSTLWHGVINDITKERKNLNQLILQSESLDKALAGIAMINRNGLFTYVNSEYLRMWGYDNKKEVIGTSPALHCYDPNIIDQMIQTLKTKREASIEFRAQRKDGTLFDVLMAIKKFIDLDGNIFYLGSGLDVSKMKKIERQLRQSATVFENTTEGVMITDANSIIVDVNEAFTKISEYNCSEVIGKNPSILKSGRHNKDFYKLMWNSITNTGSWQGEIWNRRKNGEIYPQWLNISIVKNNLGKTENFISVFSDITALKATEEKLDFLAHHDYLTELPNRILLKARLEHTLNIAKRNKTLTAVIFMDIDNFKNINDSYGHTFGDAVLVAMSKRINNIIKEDDTLARIGGDEFVIAMNHFKSPEQIAYVVQDIMDLFEKSFIIEEKEFWITLSIGISIAPDDGTNTDTLIKNADTAMYKAKEDGKNTYKFYNDKMSASSFERIVFESALKMGINNNEFEVYYQPQEDLQNNKIIGFEALVRWHHPTLGIVSPARFIPIAEETKMILPIGEFVLKQACKDIKKWHQEGLCKGRIAVNVSGVQLEHSDFAEILKYCLTHYEVDPSMIEIEVTESMVMKNPERWIRILEEIKRIGISISIDDFGTGYSSLSYLRRLPANTLKIDQSFVQDTPDENDACAIVNAIINMADSLGLETLAEGVETIEQRNYLVKKGCKYAQGYLLSKPMSGKDTYNWLLERR